MFRFSTLLTAVSKAVLTDLAETLAGPGPLTLFAPTNDAFDRILSINALLNDKEELTEVSTNIHNFGMKMLFLFFKLNLNSGFVWCIKLITSFADIWRYFSCSSGD